MRVGLLYLALGGRGKQNQSNFQVFRYTKVLLCIDSAVKLHKKMFELFDFTNNIIQCIAMSSFLYLEGEGKKKKLSKK